MIAPASCPRRLAALAGHGLLVAAALAAVGRRLPAAEVTITLVAADRAAEPLADRQAAWVSPFGGWVVTTWPFSVKVDDAAVLGYASAEVKRLDASLGGKERAEEQAADELAAEITAAVAEDERAPPPFDPREFRLERPPTATISLGEGRHVIEPFGIELTVAAGGGIASKDPRVRIDPARGRVEIACTPVIFRTVRGGASVPAPLAVACGGKALTGGLDVMLADVANRQVQAGPAKTNEFLRLTLFLPASAPGRGYTVGGVPFEVTAEGRVELKETQQARLVEGREIRLVQAATAGPKTASIEVPPLTARPGGAWSVRIKAAADGAALPKEIPARLESIAGKDSGSVDSDSVEMNLKAAAATPAGTEYAGTLPEAPGLWRITAAAGSPLAGRPLGLVWIGAEPPRAAVSFFTPGNRGVFRRGDGIDILWAGKPAGRLPGDAPVILRGPGLEKSLGTLAGGSVRLDTTALPPGTYEAATRGEGIACYPLRFRVCQREPVSDYEMFSATFGGAAPYAKSPVTAYYGGVGDTSGLAPFLAETDASLDAALATSAEDPLGPAVEKFVRPSAEELSLMALAGQGMRVVFQYPTLFHHEDWNPKHTLPEDLAQMRRRLALFAQPRAEVAGFGGITMGWYASVGGNWEESPCLDGHQARRNAAAGKWIGEEVQKAVEKAAGIPTDEREALSRYAGLRAGSSILPNAWEAYLADVRDMAPGLTSHNAIPSWWLGGGNGYSPYAYSTLTDRNAVDYSDYGLTAWGNFRTPAWMAMGNRTRQKLRCDFFANQMHNRIAVSFAATGRGLDGFAMPCDGGIPQGEDEALRRIFERFGSFFSALEPMRDVAVYDSATNPQNVALHDLARMRRPGMLVGPEDVLAGELEGCRVLLLVQAPAAQPPGVLDAFKKFEAAGGIILKDRTTAASLPGRDLGFGYEGQQVHPVWGLAYANGEAEFAHLWENFKKTREKFLVEAFKGIPPAPVTTADHDAVISPLAGRESICCFVVNQTLVPTELAGRWRQYFVLPKNSELRGENGWHVHDLLRGGPAPLEKTAAGWKTPIDFTRLEGAIYLLTKREPKGMAIRTERTGPLSLRLTGWLADAAGKPLPDPMPFEVTLRGRGDAVLFRSFAALAPDRPLDLPVPAASAREPLRLVVRDLVVGSTAEQPIEPATADAVAATHDAEWIGGREPIAAFLAGTRPGPVTILLDEQQQAMRPAAERLEKLLGDRGRTARVVAWDPADVRPLPLRWLPTKGDEAVVAGLEGGRGFASRVALVNVEKTNPVTGQTVEVFFDDPRSGYDEFGPRLRHDADIVLFGTPETNRAVAEIAPHLRRLPSAGHPAPAGFFVHHLWSPFQAGFNGLYVGCHDAAGAEAAVAALASLEPAVGAAAAEPPAAAAPVTTAGGPAAPLDDMIDGRFGSPVVDIAFSADGRRVFAAFAGIGAQLATLSADGTIEDKRVLHHARDSLYRTVQPPLASIDDRVLEAGLAGTRYRYSLDKGFISQWSPPAARFFGQKAIQPAAATVLDDGPHGRSFLGGRRRLHALDREGRPLWTHDDEAEPLGGDRLKYPRLLFPRAVSGNGKVLLASGFSSIEMALSAKAANPTVFGLDAATGKVLWRNGLLLNYGSVLPLDDAFMVVDDKGAARVLRAADGGEVGRQQPIKGSARVLGIPGRDELLVVENDTFDADGPAARVFLRPLAGGADRVIPVSGRVTDVAVFPDGRSVLVVTARGETLRVGVEDGSVEWRAATPSGGIVRLAPDAAVAWIGGRDGVVHRLDAATGRPLGTLDLNPLNVTTPEEFVRQMSAVGEVPVASDARTPPPAPVEPSYRTTLDRDRVPLGPNLIPGTLASDTPITLRVEAGRTYLVELVASVASAKQATPRTRLEIAVTGKRATTNLPFVARLPLTADPTRRRAAFRADESGEVVLRLRAVEPGAAGAGQDSGYEKAEPSAAGLVIAEPLVAAIGFQGPNLLLEGGPMAKRAAAGDLACAVIPWTGGSSLVRSAPFPCVASALRMVDGRITGEDTAWGPAVTGAEVESATGIVRFKKPRVLTSIAIYEDTTGPVRTSAGVAERAASRYGLFVRRPGGPDLIPVGQVVDNTNLVNVFPCPPGPVEEIHWIWAGRADTGRTDGPVRMAEIEAYGEDLDDLLQEPIDDPL